MLRLTLCVLLAKRCDGGEPPAPSRVGYATSRRSRATSRRRIYAFVGPDHSPGGLMRAHWYDDELRSDVEADWLLGPRDAMRMRFALLRRSMPFATPAVLTAGVSR